MFSLIKNETCFTVKIVHIRRPAYHANHDRNMFTMSMTKTFNLNHPKDVGPHQWAKYYIDFLINVYTVGPKAPQNGHLGEFCIFCIFCTFRRSPNFAFTCVVVQVISIVRNIQMPNSDVTIDDVRKTRGRKFVISYHQIHHLKELG